jgi:hypothetical protein
MSSANLQAKKKQGSADNDFITTISQVAGDQNGLDLPNPFPDIPDPPEGWDPEANPQSTFEESLPPPPWVPRKQGQPEEYLPYARVFIIGNEGNPEYEDILRRGAKGDVVLAKKEVADMKGTGMFKVYLEWMEPR